MVRKVLVVEDDAKTREILGVHLQGLNCQVDYATDGQEGVEKAEENDYALIILDLTLPRLNGYEVCKAIRKVKEESRILMLTSRADEVDKVLGLELGADDYVTKPFSARELIARINALFRRQSPVQPSSSTLSDQGSLTFGKLLIDCKRHEAQYGGKVIPLTAMEFDLLVVLASNPGRAFSKSELIERLTQYGTAVYESVIATHICRIRKKMETDSSVPQYISTIRGVGYRFVEPSEISA